jgi:thymidylate synthase
MSRSVHTHRNITFAVAAALSDLVQNGKEIKVREESVLELRNRITVLQKPMERCLFLRRRGDSIVGNVAEALWVMAGKNEISWLESYLPRAKDFSDDGRTWRAAYGPRLRQWHGVDQFKAVRDLILAEKETRRASMSLFDPGKDYVQSKDIPCNNWLHWLVRDNRLNLNVAVRSNDVVWGFSGVNNFEWSTLQQMMAHWCGVEMGEVTYLASSFHLYKERHLEKAKNVIAGFRRVTCYDFGLSSPPFQTSLEEFDQALTEWFRIEAEFRRAPDSPLNVNSHLGDPWLANAASLIRLHHGVAAQWTAAKLGEYLAQMPTTDLTAAAYEYFGRRHPEILTDIPHPRIAQFIERYGSDKAAPLNRDEAKDYIKKLHAKKNAVYGPAWKKRGEMTSIMANVARKVDRIAEFLGKGTEIDSESIVDTAVDLFVYLTKYRLFLMDESAVLANGVLPDNAPKKFSDHVKNFDVIVDLTVAAEIGTWTVPEVAQQVVDKFEALHAFVEKNRDPAAKHEQVTSLTSLSFRYFLMLAEENGLPVLT